MPDCDYRIPTLDDRLAPDVLRDRLRDLEADGVARRLMDEALAKVTSWSWTAQHYGGGERVEPFWRERHELGTRVKESPGPAQVDERCVSVEMRPDNRIRRSKTFREFGRDADGRLVVSRLVCDDPTSGWAWHLSRDTSAAEIWLSETESLQTAPTATAVRSVRRTSWHDGRIVASAHYENRYDGPFWEAESYGYREAKLDTISAWSMRLDAGGWSVWPHPRPMQFWTVNPGGKALQARPANGSTPPQLSDHELDELEDEYVGSAATALPDMAEVAWRYYSEWRTSRADRNPPAHPVCFISLPRHPSGLANLYCLRILTTDELAELQSRRSYRPLDAYLRLEGHGYGAADFSEELNRANSLGTELSDELHRRRDDQRIQRVVEQLLGRLRAHDWSTQFPISELLIVCIDETASKRARRAQLERSIGASRLAMLAREETAITEASKASALTQTIKLSQAKHALLSAIGKPPSERGPVSHLWEAFTRFTAMPVDRCEPATDGDLILIEWNADDDHFHLSFVRQLTPDGPNYKYAGMHTVSLDIALALDPHLADIENGNAWLRPTDPEYTQAAESLPALKAAQAIVPMKWQVQAGQI